MPHDKNGKKVEVGDQVTILATVTEVYEQEDACNAQVQVNPNPDVPGEYAPSMTFNTRLMEIVEPAA